MAKSELKVYTMNLKKSNTKFHWFFQKSHVELPENLSSNGQQWTYFKTFEHMVSMWLKFDINIGTVL